MTNVFYQLDVFTDTPLAGNPLAVFPDAADVPADKMQQIAREMNLSETVFVLPSDKALRRLRIFTPTKELPIAGHPVVGTWNLLAQLGVVENAPRDGSIVIEHELGVGVLPVEIECSDGKPRTVTMTQGKFTFGDIVTDKEILRRIAEAFNFAPEDFALDFPVQACGIGVDFTIIPVRSLEVLKNCRANSALLEALPREFPGEFSLVTTETLEKSSKIHTRMFAPEFGITEDPATGSAAGTIGGYLVHHGLIDDTHDGAGAYQFTIEQGDFIERPSRLHVEITGAKGNVEQVRVGGSAVVVAKSELFI